VSRESLRNTFRCVIVLWPDISQDNHLHFLTVKIVIVVTHDVNFLDISDEVVRKYGATNFVVIERVVAHTHHHLLNCVVSVTDFRITVIDPGLC
jgi:hypothetical protein